MVSLGLAGKNIRSSPLFFGEWGPLSHNPETPLLARDSAAKPFTNKQLIWD